MRNAAGAAVAGSVSYSAGTNTAVLTPSVPLAANTTYTVTARGGSTGVKDVTGNALAADFVFSFTTGGSAPTVLGNNSIGAQLDFGDMNYMNGSRFLTGAAPFTVSSMSVYLGAIQAAPNNQFQLAIYADTNGAPGALVGSTTTGSLVANSWNSRPLGATLAANTAYWFVYNTNGDNNMRFDTGSANQGVYGTSSRTFGTWPAAFGSSVRTTAKFSIYVS
jgi:hypothetical protein